MAGQKATSRTRVTRFRESGDLESFSQDFDYGAFAVQASRTPLLPDVMIEDTVFAVAATPDLSRRGLQLLEAVLKESFMQDVRDRGARLGVVHGYINVYPAYGARVGSYYMAPDQWRIALKEVAQKVGADVVDISDTLVDQDEERLHCYDNDSHPTPFWHYETAEALANFLLENPAFMEVVRKARKNHQYSAATMIGELPVDAPPARQ